MKRERERFEIFTYLVKSTTDVDTGCYVLVVKAKEREQGRFEIYTYLLKSTRGVDTGCYASVVKAKDREREREESKGGLKYIYLLGEIYKKV